MTSINRITERRAEPVGKRAAIVAAEASHAQEYNRNGEFVSQVPLPVRMCRRTVMWRGRRYGRLTVMGVSTTHTRKVVCRCDCGRYCLRQRKKLKKQIATAKCGECQSMQLTKNKDYWLRTGKDRHDM